MQLLLLSGPVASGKSAISAFLQMHHGFLSIRSGNYLSQLANARGQEINRSNLQQLGDSLDNNTDYRWLIDDVAVPTIAANASVERWLLDSVRKVRQVEHFRSRFDRSALHVHVTAPEAILRQRYEARLAAGGEYAGRTAYDAAIAHPNEISARSLATIADFSVDTAALSSEAAAEIILNGWNGA